VSSEIIREAVAAVLTTPHDANLTATLAGIRDRSERPVPGVSALPVSNPAVRSFMESAADVPRLLAAVEAVLAVADQYDEEFLTRDYPINSVASECADRIREAIGNALLQGSEATEAEL
jgi:hypothetical protein